jgi:phosphatidylserine decarboxylase
MIRIAPEGTPFILIAAFILVGLLSIAFKMSGAWWIAAGIWAPITIWVVLFFRDPLRPGDRGENLIIAPADGVVVSITEMPEDDYVASSTTRVAIFMNVFNVHVNRYPVTGVVEYRNYRPGRFFNASLDKASIHNEQMSLGINSTRGKVLVRQIAGLIARRIVTDPQPGDSVSQGERLGLIRFGSRVDTFVPRNARITVEVGTKTQAGVTVIGVWE